MTIKAYYLSPDGNLRQQLDSREIVDAFTSGEGLLWVDIVDTSQEDAGFLEQDMHFHHLAVEDCLSPAAHSPKIDDFDDHVFITVHGINHVKESDTVETAELNIFLGPNFVVSNHNFFLYSVEGVMRLVENDGRPMRRGADFLAHALIDSLIDNVLPTVDRMSEVSEDIEEEVIRNPQQSILESILKLKRSILRVHRIMAPQREVLNRLSRGEFPIIKAEAQIFYRDIYDHLVRIEDLNQGIRDSADNALATYLSSVANRQNETMRVLSTVATVFMPLTLVAGIYGMNFEYMPELKWRWAYFAVLGLIVSTIATAVWGFWVRNWITLGRRKILKVTSFAVEPEKLKGYISHLSHLAKRPGK
ncbi:MAG: magnesium/cobalt transporter CorA [Dehalococcoidia bacterium]|nr:magnesium/cobalt transporter CorA [Dehalococcoidia bacterium]MDZ4247495.1 magnesium/cobalt transporter CorA [Dehalococcoidia bacterium]